MMSTLPDFSWLMVQDEKVSSPRPISVDPCYESLETPIHETNAAAAANTAAPVFSEYFPTSKFFSIPAHLSPSSSPPLLLGNQKKPNEEEKIEKACSIDVEKKNRHSVEEDVPLLLPLPCIENKQKKKFCKKNIEDKMPLPLLQRPSVEKKKKKSAEKIIIEKTISVESLLPSIEKKNKKKSADKIFTEKITSVKPKFVKKQILFKDVSVKKESADENKKSCIDEATAPPLLLPPPQTLEPSIQMKKNKASKNGPCIVVETTSPTSSKKKSCAVENKPPANKKSCIDEVTAPPLLLPPPQTLESSIQMKKNKASKNGPCIVVETT